MNESIIKNWKPVLEYLGWKQVDVEIPLFAKMYLGDSYFEAIPDTIGGLIPVEIVINEKKQREIHDYIKDYADHIFIGDLNGKWKLPEYDRIKTNYQVIDTKNLKLEKDTRNQISQAQRYGVKVRKMKPEDNYWACVQDAAKRQNREGVSEGVLEVMKGYFNGLVATLHGQVIAGCLYAGTPTIHLVHSASLTDTIWNRPNHAVMAVLIEIAASRTIYLGNSPAKLEGLDKFKKSFGATTKSFNIRHHANQTQN